MAWKFYLTKSQSVNVPRRIMVATREDYVRALIEDGQISSETELASNPDLVVAVHEDWLQERQVGCVYAQQINSKPTNYIAEKRVIEGDDPVVLAASIDSTTVAAVDSEQLEALSLLLPSVSDMATLCSLIHELAKYDRWKVRPAVQHVEPSSGTLYALVGLDFILPDGIVSAVLGLGPFEELPMTRRGPFTSLEMRTKSSHAKPAHHRPGFPLVSHLAQIPLEDDRIAAEHEYQWQQTTQLRLTVLGSNDARAKAEVTFAVPWDLFVT